MIDLMIFGTNMKIGGNPSKKRVWVQSVKKQLNQRSTHARDFYTKDFKNPSRGKGFLENFDICEGYFFLKTHGEPTHCEGILKTMKENFKNCLFMVDILLKNMKFLPFQLLEPRDVVQLYVVFVYLLQLITIETTISKNAKDFHESRRIFKIINKFLSTSFPRGTKDFFRILRGWGPRGSHAPRVWGSLIQTQEGIHIHNHRFY